MTTLTDFYVNIYIKEIFKQTSILGKKLTPLPLTVCSLQYLIRSSHIFIII